MRVFSGTRMLWLSATVICLSSSESHLDVCLLKITSYLSESDRSGLVCVEFHKDFTNSMKGLQMGRFVGVLGFPFIAPVQGMGCCYFFRIIFSLDFEPIASVGILRKIVEIEGKSLILQSSACVLSGNSGCPLILEDGTWIGMVTNNTRESIGSDLIPRLNFSIPVSEFYPIFQYLNKKIGLL